MQQVDTSQVRRQVLLFIVVVLSGLLMWSILPPPMATPRAALAADGEPSPRHHDAAHNASRVKRVGGAVGDAPAAAPSGDEPAPSPDNVRAPPQPPASKPRRPRFYVISFMNEGANSLGVMWGAQSRSCYAAMHGYHSIMYNDADLPGWIPQGELGSVGRSDGGRIGADPASRAQWLRWWSKNFMMRRTFETFNLTEDDWVFWFDADTIITNPKISLEAIVQSASSPRARPPANAVPPHIVVSNTFNGLNNGVYGLRATAWSRRFLTDWFEDRNSTHVVADNGPFMHSMLREVYESRGIRYQGECHMMGKCPACAEWGAFSECYMRHMQNVACKGDVANCMSRCPNSRVPFGSFDPWDAGRGRGSDYEVGWIPADGLEHIGGYCRMNDGIGWGPVAQFDETSSFLLHLAGSSKETRNDVMTRYAHKFSDRFSPRCF